MTTEVATAPDFEKAGAIVGKVYEYFGGMMACSSIWLGDKLGLYQHMAGAGPLTSAEVAVRAGLHERWVREWLSQQAAAGFIDYQGGVTFELSPEAALVFADESTMLSAVGFMDWVPATMSMLDSLPESFRTGVGHKYDDHGAQLAAAMERASAPTNSMLVDAAVPALDGVGPKLEAGALVADVGCGSGGRLVTLAKHYPNSRFRGYDISEFALERGRANAEAAGVTNLTFHNPTSDPMPTDHSIDLVMFGDVVHDLADPDGVFAAVAAALKPDGTVLVIDFAAADTLEENIAHPMATMLFGVSQLICLSSSMSEPGGAGIGTLGLSPGRLQGIAQKAGLTRFRRTDVADPFNAYYEIRP
jgi:SAM-dependent methyltransferase